MRVRKTEVTTTQKVVVEKSRSKQFSTKQNLQFNNSTVEETSSLDDTRSYQSKRLSTRQKPFNNCAVETSFLDETRSSLKMENDDQLEDYVFHDISMVSNDAASLSNSFLSDDEDTFVDHAQRSKFRHFRREWYLNRRLGRNVAIVKLTYCQIIWNTIITFITTLTTFTEIFQSEHSTRPRIIKSTASLLNCVISEVFSFFVTYFCIVKSSAFYLFCSTKLLLAFLWQSSTDGTYYIVSSAKELLLALAHFLCGKKFGYILLAICMLPLLTLITGYFSSDIKAAASHNASDFGLDNTQSVLLDTNLPAWYIGTTPSQNSPIVLLLRNGGTVHQNEYIELYKTLVSLGYQLVVPFDQLKGYEVRTAWKWLKKTAPNALPYLWGIQVDAGVLSSYGKEFCSDLIPPSGIVISYEVPSEEERSLEVWSCNCTLVERTDGNPHWYNHVRCPITWTENTYQHVVSCIGVLSRKPRS